MYGTMKNIIAGAAMAAVACGCAGASGSQAFAGGPPSRAAVPAADCTKPVLEPIELEKTDYRFRRVGGFWNVTANTPDVDVVVNKHGLDPHQIDIQPSRTGPNVVRAVITVTDAATGCAYSFTAIVQK